ncbi:MAG: PilN domain-containing protein [Phycisphaeraceae bacterium]
MESVNLIPAARREARGRHMYMRRWGVGVATYAGVLLGAWLASQLIFGGPGRAAADDLAELHDQAKHVEEQIRALKPKLAEAQTTLAASRSVGSQPDWSLLLTLLSQELGEHVMLTSLRLEPVSSDGIAARRDEDPADQSQYRLRMAGLGERQSAVSDYVLRLERTGLFDKVVLIDTRKEPFRETMAVGFRVECALRP